MNGSDKAQLVLDRRPLIERTVELLTNCFRQVLIVAPPQRNYLYPGVTLVSDEQPRCGPLMGLYSGLRASRHQLNFVMGCDMPFVSETLIHLLIAEATKADVVVPIVRGFREPLLAVYNKTALPFIKNRLDAGQRKMVSFLDQVNVCEIAEQRLRTVDPHLRSFININTPEDLAQARKTSPPATKEKTL